VKGAKRSLVCDLQRNSFTFIPNLLYDVFEDMRGKSITEIRRKYPREYRVIKQYIDELVEAEFAFYTDTPALFPKINYRNWDEPSEITHAIVDVDKSSKHDYSNLFFQFALLGCFNIQMRFFDAFPIEFYTNLFSQIEFQKCFVDLIVRFHQSLSLDHLNELSRRNRNIRSIIVHSAMIDSEKIGECNDIQYIRVEIKNEACCGVISPKYFATNIKSFSEAINWNSCLNRKISIDKNSQIKNCPSMKTSYGNSNNLRLSSALRQKGFKRLWKINKDTIEVCQDCEFRYICTDCRAYVEKGIRSKPTKCLYDPYSTNGFDDYFGKN
jgi:SPASM domain peptide maturase of grasp-with-spasm system